LFIRFGDWLDARLGHRAVLQKLRGRILPQGPSWWLTSASCLFWLFVLQCLTGLMLMASYSPSMASAWASVHFIDQTAAGRFIRGLHHFTSHAMIVLFVVHVARVLIAGAFRAPRELVWVTGLLLLPLIVVWTVTGNPLSGSQKGMAQIEVEGNILGSTPLVGPMLQRMLIGGDEVGNLTLTHLYFLHVGLLPLLVGLLCAVHLQQVYRHSLVSEPKASHPTPAATPYWPYQTIRNQAVLAVVVAIVGGLAWTRGAPLDAPADASLLHSPRPEWYFRWIFELRRHFSGDWEFVATMIVPAAILGFFLAVPLLDRALTRRLGLAVRLLVVLVGLGAWGSLTWVSYSRDWRDAEFLAGEQEFQELSQRAQQLADEHAVSSDGAQELLRGDARTQGPLLFRKHCASCHSHADAQGHGIVAAEPSAPNLYGFGTTEWILGMVDRERIVSPQVFGHTKFKSGDMAGKIAELFDDAGEDGQAELQTQLRQVARALSAEAALASQQEQDRADAADIVRGRELLMGSLSCTDCHRFHDQGDLGSAPDLTGYGSRAWLEGMIAKPTHERFYRDHNDRMPSFAGDQVHPETNLLSPGELKLLVDWLRGEWWEVKVAGGGE
jgi:ubiquinol-cytochrome c reductase cytochrome b subunit